LALLKKRYYEENREIILARKREYTRAVSATVIAKRRDKRRNDPKSLAKHNHNGALRRSAEVRATPAWADLAKIESIYLAALNKSRETGIKYSVDHIYPLRGKTVCGLHVPDNLQVITLRENCSKQNSF